MTRPQILFAVVVLFVLGLVGVALGSQAKNTAHRAENARLDSINKVLVARVDSAVLASAPILAENDSLVPVVEEAVEESAETSERLVGESEAQQAVAVAVGGSFRSRLDSAMVPAFDSVIAAERQVASIESERADSAEATIVTINAAYKIAQSALAHAKSGWDLALMSNDSLRAAGAVKDAIIAYQDDPPFLVRAWNALPEVGGGVLGALAVVCIVKC